MRSILLGVGAYFVTFLMVGAIRSCVKHSRKKPPPNHVANLVQSFRGLLRQIAADLQSGVLRPNSEVVSAMVELLTTMTDLLEQIPQSGKDANHLAAEIRKLLRRYPENTAADLHNLHSLVLVELWLFDTSLMPVTAQRRARLTRRGWFRLPSSSCIEIPPGDWVPLDQIDQLWNLGEGGKGGKVGGSKSIFDDEPTKPPGANLDDTLDNFPIPGMPADPEPTS